MGAPTLSYPYVNWLISSLGPNGGKSTQLRLDSLQKENLEALPGGEIIPLVACYL